MGPRGKKRGGKKRAPVGRGKGMAPKGKGGSLGPYETSPAEPDQEQCCNNPNWSHKLTGFMADPPMCILSWCCPCIVVFQSAQKLELPNPIVWLIGTFCWNSLTPLRYYCRQKYGIKGNIAQDMCATGLSGLCALCQISNEIKTRNGELQKPK